MNLIDRVINNFGPEDREQYAVIQYCDARNISVFHIPNSTWTKSPMVRMKNTLLGVRAGIPDLCVVLPNIGLVFIEMKQTGPSKTSPDQRAWIALLNQVPGVESHVCKGAEQAVAVIEELLANGKTTPIPKDIQDALEDRNEF